MSAEFKEIKPEEWNQNVFESIGQKWMLIGAGDQNKVNAMTASWGGMGILWHKKVVFAFIRPQRYTKEFIDSQKTFSLTFYPEEQKKMLQYMGSVSGRDENKIEKSGLTVCFDGGTPYFQQAEAVVICKKLMVQPFKEENILYKELIEKNYPDKDFHMMYVGEIEKVLIK